MRNYTSFPMLLWLHMLWWQHVLRRVRTCWRQANNTHCLLDRPAPNPITNTGKRQQDGESELTGDNLKNNGKRLWLVQRSHRHSTFVMRRLQIPIELILLHLSGTFRSNTRVNAWIIMAQKKTDEDLICPRAAGMRNTAWHKKPTALFILNNKPNLITKGDLWCCN